LVPGSAVAKPGLAATDHASQRAVEARLDDPIETRIADEEAAADLIGQQLARDEQWRRRRRFLIGKPEQPAVEDAGGLELADHLADETIEGLEEEFTLVLADDLALRIDAHQRRPGAHRVRLPHADVAVGDDGMADV